jgi:hypothetical protein
MEDNAVRLICDVMEGYERCTGLGLNKGKTQLMVCGSENWAIGTKIFEITVVDSVSILGIKIDRKLERLNENWDNAIVKMRRYCAFWWNFGLSISGRVMVVKTYVLTQAIYLMGILSLPMEKGDQMNEIMTEFVRGRDRVIENRRKNLCAELGGYGIIDMNVMNISMKCSWIKRWKEEQTCADYPRAIVMGEGNVELDRIVRSEENDGSYSLLTDIRNCWHKLKTEFYRRGSNREEILLFENDTFTEEGRGLESVIFGRGRYTQLADRIRDIRVKDIVDDDMELQDRNLINRKFRTNISWAEYFRLREEVTRIDTELGERLDQEDSMTLNEWMESNRKGAKRFREVLVGRRSQEYKSSDPREIASGITLWGNGVAEMNRVRIELNFSAWNINCLEAGFKDFLFKLVHGKLYLNQIAAHFSDTRPQCTFCTIEEQKRLQIERIAEDSVIWNTRINGLHHESVTHLFWECQYVRRVINELGNRLAGTVGRIFTKAQFFGGLDDISIMNMKMSILIVHYIKYYIFKCRLRHRLPYFSHGIYDIGWLFEILAKREVWREQVEDIAEITQRMMTDAG